MTLSSGQNQASISTLVPTFLASMVLGTLAGLAAFFTYGRTLGENVSALDVSVAVGFLGALGAGKVAAGLYLYERAGTAGALLAGGGPGLLGRGAPLPAPLGAGPGPPTRPLPTRLELGPRLLGAAVPPTSTDAPIQGAAEPIGYPSELLTL